MKKSQSPLLRLWLEIVELKDFVTACVLDDNSLVANLDKDKSTDNAAVSAVAEGFCSRFD
jgi:hypothetical protein